MYTSFSFILSLIISYFFKVISHQYGASGAEPKALDTKSIIIDFELIQELSRVQFIETLKKSVTQFIQTLKETQTYSGTNTMSF